MFTISFCSMWPRLVSVALGLPPARPVLSISVGTGVSSLTGVRPSCLDPTPGDLAPILFTRRLRYSLETRDTVSLQLSLLLFVLAVLRGLSSVSLWSLVLLFHGLLRRRSRSRRWCLCPGGCATFVSSLSLWRRRGGFSWPLGGGGSGRPSTSQAQPAQGTELPDRSGQHVRCQHPCGLITPATLQLPCQRLHRGTAEAPSITKVRFPLVTLITTQGHSTLLEPECYPQRQKHAPCFFTQTVDATIFQPQLPMEKLEK